jgi:hypothetical protein
MARTYNGSSQYAYADVADGLGITGNDPVWASFWFWPNSTAASYGVFNIGVSGSTNHYRRVTSGGGNVLGSSGGAGTNASASAALAGAAQWQHILAEWGGVTSRKIAVNNGTPGTNATSINITSAPNHVRLAATLNLSAYMAGRLAWIGVFSGVPTDDQKAALAAGAHPAVVSPATLLDAWDKIGEGSTEGSWRGNALTLVNSPTRSDSPRIYLPRGRSMIVVPSSAGQTLTLPTIASTATLAVPTLAAGAVALALPAIASTAVLLAPALSAGVVALGLPAIAAGSVLSAPALTAGAVTVSLPAIGSTASLAAPAIGAGAVSVGMPTIASGAVLTAPAVAPGVAAVALPNIGTTATLFAPTVIGAGAVALPAIASTASLAPPTLTAGAVAVSLPAIASSSATYAPTLAGVATLALPTIASQSALYAPALVPGVLSLALPTLASTSALFSPTIIDGVIPTYTTIVLGAARAGVARITARAGRSSITARTHLSE